MDKPGFTTAQPLSECRVVIWGLGLMGGSLALALKGKCAGVIGIDADLEVVAYANTHGVVDAAHTLQEVNGTQGNVLDGAALIILATPVRTILSVLAMLPEVCSGAATVIDLGSTKKDIVAAMNRLPTRFSAVGGHPMCGKEKSSLHFAEAGIYQNAPFALVSLERTTPAARALAEELVCTVNAVPRWMEAEEHDEWVAATSHVPFLVSSALAGATPASAAPMVGPGFRSTARLAASSPEMMVDILATNAKNISASLEAVKVQLSQYQTLLEQGHLDLLADLFISAGERYKALVEA